MKKNILIACQPLEVGGVTTSLLALLNSVDYEKYNVDLILMRNEGEFTDKIPSRVNLLAPALKEKNYYTAKLRKLFSYLFRGYLIYRPIYNFIYGKKYKNGDFQLMAGLARCNTARKLEKYYDAAIGYMEGFDNYYIAKKVKAKKKICYVHVDYENSGLDPKLDKKTFAVADRIVLVSENNKKSFDKVFPEYVFKSVVVENSVSESLVRKMAEESVDFSPNKNCFNIITVARLVIKHKGLDRAVNALDRLIKDGYDVYWYVFGDGEDRNVLQTMIKKAGLEDRFILMGNRANIYPYIKMCDLFVLPSRYEGKPISVTEAQLLETPPVVTEYLSAHEQIQNGIDGIIVNNDDNSIYDGIKSVLDNKDLLDVLRRNLRENKNGANIGLKQFYELLEQE